MRLSWFGVWSGVRGLESGKHEHVPSCMGHVGCQPKHSETLKLFARNSNALRTASKAGADKKHRHS